MKLLAGILVLSLLFFSSLSFVAIPHRHKNYNNYHQSAVIIMVTKSTEECFEGKSVLLTGASGGLGSALAEKLSCCGVSTLILSGRNKDALMSVSEKCKKHSPNCQVEIVTCDLDDRGSVYKLGERALEICGTVDVLVNNGGVSSRSDFLDTKLEVDEKLMQINFFSGVSLAKMLVPNMVTQKEGKIIWISSVQGM